MVNQFLPVCGACEPHLAKTRVRTYNTKHGVHLPSAGSLRLEQVIKSLLAELPKRERTEV